MAQKLRPMCWIVILLSIPYFILLLWIYAYLRRIKPYESSKSSGIFVSVVAACRNEAGNIRNLLSDIADQSYDSGKFEVIIVDDNSTDGTFMAASEFPGIQNLKTIRNEGRGKKEALMSGIVKASGELIITTDGDCRAGPEWITTIVQFYEEYKPDMIICPVKMEARQGFPGRFQELEFLSLQGITAGTVAAGMSTMCNGANLAFTREVYIRHSGNLRPEIASGDDIFLLHSVKKEKTSEIRWLESIKALVIASGSNAVWPFLRQRRRWISKTRAYRDMSTILLASVTLAATIAQAGSFILATIDYRNLITFIVVLFIKSIPDFLILSNTSRRYGRASLMKWFLPSQIIYPFYVLSAVLLAATDWKNHSVNYPFLREI